MILVIATLISVASMGSTPGQPVPRPPPRPRRQTIGAAAAGRGAIGFSSFAVLLYYAIANASAWTLGRRIIPAVGLVGCLVLAFVLPVLSQWVPPSSRSAPLGMDSPLAAQTGTRLLATRIVVGMRLVVLAGTRGRPPLRSK